jgi:hypothetical protein
MGQETTESAARRSEAVPSRAELRKRIGFVSFMLGVMAGIGAFLIVAAIQKQKPALSAIVIALFVTAIPLAKSLPLLRRQLREQED